ncbi:plastoglobulin-1, chloroplastic [Typha latifolia]|uniref:plastoglobulin-1, chloroplastic n=1 Tax=Typha latifolia TaxID=4733 RepID=UPI003C2B2F19
MASFLFSPHASLLSPNPNFHSLPLLPKTLTHPFLHPRPRNPNLLSISAAASGPGRRRRRIPGQGPGTEPSSIPDEWGEESQPDPEVPSEADPPKDDEEWGSDPKTEGTAAGVVDEWGEKADPEQEAPSVPDPPRDEDEWGKEPGGDSYLPGNGSPVPSPEDEKLGNLKRCLVDSIYGTELGFSASAEVRAEIFELVNQLEAENPTPAPTEVPALLDGNWILLYTAFSELLPLLSIGAIPSLKVKSISQEIDSGSMTIVNATTLSSPFASFSFSASASFEIRSPLRIQVQFKEGTIQPPDISSNVVLPEQVDIFGQKISLKPVEQALNPIQQAVANITRAVSGQPPLKVPLPGNRAESWLLTTYLDEDFRISRGDGGLFILAKEGSPLLDQLS